MPRKNPGGSGAEPPLPNSHRKTALSSNFTMAAWKSAPFPYDVKVGIAYDLNLENNISTEALTTASNQRGPGAFSAPGSDGLGNFRRALSQLENVEYLIPAHAANLRPVIALRSNSAKSASRRCSVTLIRPRVSCLMISSTVPVECVIHSISSHMFHPFSHGHPTGRLPKS
jgi:hypothetical protein